MKKFLVFSGFVVLLLLCLMLISPSGVLAQAKGAGAKYVGADTCKGCHEDYFNNFASSIHGKKYVPGNPANKDGCESCHGPGSVHVDAGGGKGSILSGAKEMAPMCLSCHQDGKELTSWDMGRHKATGVYCADCHSGHSTGKKLLKSPEPVLCYSCHKDIRAMMGRQSHHPVNEGKVKCSDCHTPHGGFGPKMIKADTNNELCFKCHAEKRGPFMWEHPPVEENCLNCHSVHGSNHFSLLVQRPPMLCSACHPTGHPSTLYGANQMFTGPNTSIRAVGRSCVNCHVNIHGSNGPGSFGQFFVR